MTGVLNIDQVAHILQVDIDVLKEWEIEFASYFSKNAKKPVCYDETDLETFAQIKELLEVELYTLEGAKRRLELTTLANGALGIEQNFKTTVFFMFSTIMQELERSREESRHLAYQLEMLRKEKGNIQEILKEEQRKTLWRFLVDRLGS